MMQCLYVPDQQAPSPSYRVKPKTKPLLLTALLCAFSAQTVMADVFINEIHYDNAGSDVGESIEVAGDAGTDLSGWSIVFYNGNNSQSYRTTDLTGVLPNQQDGFGTLDFTLPSNGIQNGAPDGMALVDPSAQVVQFLSYEGTLTASNGPANGMTSVDIGVSESSGTPVGNSLQLSGSGSQAADFSWEADSANTFGAINTNQTFGGGGPQVDTPPSVTSTTPMNNSGINALAANIDVSFSEGVDLSADWFVINCSVTGTHTAAVSGGPQHYSLDPDVDFVFNEICTVNVVAALVTDIDSNDPPDNMESDFSFSFATEVNSTIRINEVDADTSGTDTLEFIELYDGGAGNTSLDGLVVVLYNGSDSQSYNSAFDLDGFSTNEEGYFLLGNELVTPLPSLI
ncbi:MAG: Ig-like domain-containing protein, partial [Gammaproteobacteria bacterium]|nr:Ig-like domain-containing protein [Gammaproteobacteria bacterium]MBV1928163.1 Ig-like domain-containing protein [Gammaproteobacteria bacterium]